jgi:hypothetical protein
MDGETMEIETSEATVRVLALFLQRQRGRLFECKTCGRRFTTFQALGGHRASHRRPSPDDHVGSQKMEAACAPGPSVHGCPMCGVEFAVGQALGGHMRRHRAVAASAGAQGPAPGLRRRKSAAPGPRRPRRLTTVAGTAYGASASSPAFFWHLAPFIYCCRSDSGCSSFSSSKV